MRGVSLEMLRNIAAATGAGCGASGGSTMECTAAEGRAAVRAVRHRTAPVTALLMALWAASHGLSHATVPHELERRDSVTSADPLSATGPARQLLSPLWNTSDFGQDLMARRSRALMQAAGEEEAATQQGEAVDPDPDPFPQPNPARRQLRNDDFVFAAPSNAVRLPLAQASRYWRKGMRAVFVMDQPAQSLPAGVVAASEKYHESFAFYPNFKRMPNNQRDHYLEGDRRAAMTPILAFASLAMPAAMEPYTAKAALPQATHGSAVPSPAAPAPAPAADPFLWMLAGDDDTLFFMRGVKALLRDYDPQLPYFLTDSMFVGSKSPQPGVWQMRCFPCHLPWGKWRRTSRRLLAAKPAAASAASQGCSCDTKTLCKRHFPGNVTRCQQEWEGPVPWGGVGFIFSIGFFKQLAALEGGKGLRAYETCINNGSESPVSFPEGGDAFMSRCMWRLGFPITDPGYTPLGRYMGEALNLGVLYNAPLNLSSGQLPSDTLSRWSTGISMHLGARQQPSFRAAALTVKYIVGVYDLVAELLWPTGRPEAL
ncbi:hypothetical protein TSOC_007050 [Tetrabaena socialis]|uniref:Uncharacterized protein n=1 Tax=Tetrabaena socialis TaxID=47790 RepID=A0A2J8A251_9CHLO|nr:hypothetical protein TSOC_007050 [Tetrabaena socialis]|eukprot:PNH06594.1 hypothetical protein TSOC_007050 [Tetrabaena socialis]